MADFYYIMSSLPMLKLGELPLLTRDELLRICDDKLSESQLATLRHLSLVPDASHNADSTAIKAWVERETCLRNRLATRRGTATHSADEYLRHENDVFSEIDMAVQEAVALDDPLERERHLDALRWRQLDDIASGEAFSFNGLCVYMIKLLLLEKWLPRDKDKGYENLDLTITGINDAMVSHAMVKTTPRVNS